MQIEELILTLPAVLIAITMHELAHGYVSYRLGDPTAKNAGRLTLNPLAHLDLIGTLSLLLFHFGWAKPVPVNPYYYKNRKKGMVMVALAGPITNFILAFLSIIGMQMILIQTGGYASEGMAYLFDLLNYCAIINVGLGAFNLIPFPPLDGSKIAGAILPEKHYFKSMQYEKYGYSILLILLVTGLLDGPLNWIIINIHKVMWFFIGLFIG